jgi:hypothetical protein
MRNGEKSFSRFDETLVIVGYKSCWVKRLH